MFRNALGLLAVASSVLHATAFLLPPNLPESRTVSLPYNPTNLGGVNSNALGKDEESAYLLLDLTISHDGRDVEVNGQPLWPSRSYDEGMSFDVPIVYPPNTIIANGQKTATTVFRSQFLPLSSSENDEIKRISCTLEYENMGSIRRGVVLDVLCTEGVFYILDATVLDDIDSYTPDLSRDGRLNYKAINAVQLVEAEVEDSLPKLDETKDLKPLRLAEYQEMLESIESKLHAWYAELSHGKGQKKKGVHSSKHSVLSALNADPPLPWNPPHTLHGPPHGRPHPRPHHGKQRHSQHGYHHRQSIFAKIGGIILAVLITMMVGFILGMMIGMIGLIVGRLISFLWFRVVRGGRRGSASLSRDEREAQPEEKARLVDDEKALVAVRTPTQTNEGRTRERSISLGSPSIFQIRLFVRY